MKPTEYYIFWSRDQINPSETNLLGSVKYTKVRLNHYVYNNMYFIKGFAWDIVNELIRRERHDILDNSIVLSSNNREYSFKNFVNHLKLTSILR